MKAEQSKLPDVMINQVKVFGKGYSQIFQKPAKYISKRNLLYSIESKPRSHSPFYNPPTRVVKHGRESCF